MINSIKKLSLSSILLLLVSCTVVLPPMNQKVTQQFRDKPPQTHHWQETNNQTLLILTFSGGGTRAAAFSYGVLKGLQNSRIIKKGGPVPLLSEVDLISSVSGGSFTAAYYGLFGEQIFSDYENRFLKHPIQSELIHRWLSPKSWGKLGSDFFNRSDLAAEYYNQQIFQNKNFSDMRKDMPLIIINSTDISAGMPFSFIPSNMNWICSDLGSYPVSRAVAASSAVPGLFSPIALKNFSGCDTQQQTYQHHFFKTSQQLTTSDKNKYQNKNRYPYLHLVDGGISDNLGIRPILNIMTTQNNNFLQFLNKYQLNHIKNVAIIVVNAADDISPQIAQTAQEPSLEETIGAVTTLQSHRYNADTLRLLAENIKVWEKQTQSVRCSSQKTRNCSKITFHIIELNLKQLPKTLAEQASLYKTSLELPEKQVDTLIYAGQYLLNHSKSYLKFIEKLNQ